MLLQFYVTAIFLKSYASHLYISGHHCDKEKCPPTGKKQDVCITKVKWRVCKCLSP